MPDYRKYKNGSFLDLRSDFSADGNWDGATFTSGTVTSDLLAMQNAVASLSSAGGGKLQVPKGHYFLGDQWDAQYMPGGPHATDAFKNQIVIDGGTGTPAEMEIDFNGSVFTTTASVAGGVTTAGAGARVFQVTGNHKNLKLKNLTIVQAKWTPSGGVPAYNSSTTGIGVASPYNAGTCNISGTAVTRLTGASFTPAMANQRFVIGSPAATDWVVAITGTTATFATSNTGRNFTPSDANQYVSIYAQPYRIVAYVNPTTVTLNAAPSFPTNAFSLATAIMTSYVAYRVDHYVDADHLVLTQPAGTFTGATTTTWIYCPLNNRGMVLENISVWDCTQAIAIGGVRDWTIDRPYVYASHGRAGLYATDASTPNVGIWTQYDPFNNPAVRGRILDCYFDGCVYGTIPGRPAAINRGMDGMIFLLSNSVDCLGGTIRNNGVEGVFHLGDRFSEFGSPSYMAESSTIADIVVDATPETGSTTHTTYGFRVDASNTSMTNITAIGNANGIYCTPGINYPGFRQNENSSINGAKIQMPSAIETGGNIMTDAYVSGCTLTGVIGFQATNMQIRQVGDYSQFLSATGIYIGAFSSEVEVSHTRVTVPQKFAVGTSKFSGLLVYGTYGSIYYTDLKVNGADIGSTIGNQGNLGDAPRCIHKRVEFANCTKAIIGNVTTCEFDRQEVIFRAGSPVGWKQIAHKYNGITGRITMINKATSLPHQRATFEFVGNGFSSIDNFASITQLRNSNNPAIDKVRLQLDRGIPGNVSLLVHFVDTTSDISIIAEGMELSSYCLIDPPFSGTTLTTALNASTISATVAVLDGMQLGSAYCIDSGTATSEMVRLDNMYPGGAIQITRNIDGAGAFAHLNGATFGIDSTPTVYADLDMRAGINTNALSLQGVPTQKLRGINGCTELVNTYGYGGTFRVNTEGGSEAYLEFIRETKTVTGGSLVDNDVSLWKGFRLRFLNTGGGGGMYMEYLTPSGTLGVPGTWTTIYAFASNGNLGLNQINLNTGGLTALFTALTGQANMAALANFAIANGDYTGNSALVAYLGSLSAANSANASAIAAKPSHGGAISGTANLTTGAVTGTIT